MGVVFFFLFSAIGALGPYLGLYYKEAGLSATEIGVLMTVSPVLLFISQPLFGPLTDKAGHRGRMLAGLLMVVAVTAQLMRFGTGFWGLLGTVALWSFFAGVLVPISDSIALGEVVRTGVAYPRLRLWGSIGFLLVTVATGWLYKLVDLRWMFPVYGVLMAVAWWYARRLPPDGVSSTRSVWPALKGLLKNPMLLAFLVVSALTWMTQAAHQAFFSVHLASIGASSATVGWAWGLAALVEVPIWWVLGNVTKKTGPLPVLTVASLIYALRWFLFSVITDPNLLLVVQVLHAFSFALFMPTAVMLVGDLVPPDLRTSGQALLVLFNGGVATIVAILGAGRIVDAAGTAALYRTGSYLALAGGIGFVLLLTALRLRGRSIKPVQGGV